MQQRWAYDPTYSHGYLVPLAALVLLWARRGRMPAASPSPNWWGAVLVGLGVAMQLVGAYYFVGWLSGAALIPYIGGATLLAGGWPVLRWASPAILFLLFMVPLPYRFDELMHRPLQSISTKASGVALQMLGLPVIVEGNVIVMDDVELGVIDACSGLKMFIIFFCLSTAIALLAEKRTLLERIFIVLSAAPIAILCNVARITATGVAYQLVDEKSANLIYHDLAGWLMMPMALLMLWGELCLLSALFIEEEPIRPAFRLSEMVPVRGDTSSASASANRPPRTNPA
jgi:exosortase